MAELATEPQDNDPLVMDESIEGAAEAAAFLKALAHPARLKILCWLADGERSVGELERLLSERQAAVSQQLSRLREDNLVTTRREGKQIFYSLSGSDAEEIIRILYDRFCRDKAKP
ncbi:helix-turn-helix transcriptional regulator [Rhodospirillaceae bacterium KN72]|uniref:Helix-turn-helix transcriptional regulator n=1 Tax=Pacificispira spongiicola TaxID=2729598 RepID=A0A7Y0E2X2_9PROT|nr:metalloregulator ArsR/SmtB family transcription factor [Pacificispira spongiicola]NMM46255.1 helix-turn-helix transcriptional regulator [Pacificispira spongiicola]